MKIQRILKRHFIKDLPVDLINPRGISYHRFKRYFKLTETDVKIYNFIHSRINEVFTTREIALSYPLSERQMITILNKLEDKCLLPDWYPPRRRNKMLTLLKRTPEQIKQAKADKKKEVRMDAELQKATDITSDNNFYDSTEWFKVPDTVESIILHWLNKEGLAKMRMPIKDKGFCVDPTKRYVNTVRAIKRLIAGTAFSTNEFVRKNRKFTIEEIKQSIDRFHLAATSDRHLPLRKNSLQRYSLETFIYSSFHKDEKYKSQFLFYMENVPQSRVEITEEAPVEKSPALTRALDNTFKDYGFVDNWRTRNTLIVVANSLYKFWIANEVADNWQFQISPNGISREFHTAITVWRERKPAERTVTPATLTQPWIIESVFKSHCERMGLLFMENEAEYQDEFADDLLDEVFTLPDDDYTEDALALRPDNMAITYVRGSGLLGEEQQEEITPDEIEVIRKVNRKVWITEKERNQYENAPYD